MKKVSLMITILVVSFLVGAKITAQSGPSLELFVEQLNSAVPEGFSLDESGSDHGDLFAVYKKSPQEIVTANLQKKNDLEFSDTVELDIQGRRAVFYYMGFEKSGGMVVFLNNGAGHLVVGYNKPYMGDEIVEQAELEEIVKKLDIASLEN